MANTRILKRRVRSISNTRQITKAMELVAAAKMRRVVQVAQQSHTYSEAAMAIIRRLTSSPEATRHPYFQPSAAKTKLYVIFTSDGGLAGAYNGNIFNAAAKAFDEDNSAGIRPMVIVFGRKGARHFARGTNLELLGDYENVPDDPEMNVFSPVLETIAEGIKATKFSAVSLLYTEFISTMVQRVKMLQVLPISPSSEVDSESPELSQNSQKEKVMVYELEPDVNVVLEEALRVYLEAALRRTRVEAAVSEHAMRMISMNNANRNAGELIDALTLELNATRQAAITQEVAEIISGAEALA